MGQLQTQLVCDFCTDPVKPNDGAWTYPANSFTVDEVGYGSEGDWLACGTCAAFIRQYDGGEQRAKDNLLRRAVMKSRHKYNPPGLSRAESDMLNTVLTAKVGDLHTQFWLHRTAAPRPYVED